jgi:hypothetical protein
MSLKIDRLLASAPSKDWISNLSGDDKIEMLEVREKFRRGAITVSMACLYRCCKEAYGITVGITAFKEWLNREQEAQ